MGYGQADQTDREMMALALQQARISLNAGGVPVGAVLAAGSASQGWQLIAAGHNERVQRGDPVAHGEIACLRNAAVAPPTSTPPCTPRCPRARCAPARSCSSRSPGWWSARPRPSPATSFLSDRGVEIVLLDDEGCMAAMQEFQTRYPQIWSEDIGGR